MAAAANASGPGPGPDMEQQLQSLAKNMDDVFLLSNAIIVSLMQAGFACLEAGAVRSKNVTNILMKNLMDIFISALAYWLIGYGLSYGAGGNGFAGAGFWAGSGLGHDRMAHWFFQFVFAATAATIVSGAVAERCRYEAYITYSALISGAVYPVAAHWVWAEGGWLRAAGYRDFAGAGPVHLLAGVCSLVGAALLGPRAGRFPAKPSAEPPPEGHATPLVGLGGLLLVSGFLAFNGGSLGAVSGPGQGGLVAHVMAATVLGGAGGASATLLLGRAGLAGGGRRWPFAHTLNGAFAGMVSVCAAADGLRLWAALAAGAVAGPLYLGLQALVARCKVDDPLSATAVHLGGGLWGVLAGALLSDWGLLLGPTHESTEAVVHQLLGIAAIAGWAGAGALLMFGALRLLGLLRVPAAAETRGLDEALHGEPGYPAAAWSVGPPPSAGAGRPCAEFHNAAFEDTEAALAARRGNSNHHESGTRPAGGWRALHRPLPD